MACLHYIVSVFCVSSALLTCFCPTPADAGDDRKVYIVYMGAPFSDYSSMSHHQSILQEVVGTNFAGDSLIRSYGRSFNGFAATLTEAEREKLAGLEGVVSVFPSRNFKLHTTRSWDFMGFSDEIKHNLEVECNIIVGVIDSGIWPESLSFSDKGFGPPPKKWKGACEGGSNFTCNNKVIGARNYVNSSSSSSSSPTVRDFLGHGSHTASTAAGNKVEGVSFYGVAQGTVRGGVPAARIAAYKVCDGKTCTSEDILAGFDDAIADGVDVITASIGSDIAVPFDEDPVAIGSFHAMEKGILTVNSAGNSGPSSQTVSSVSPWLLTVAASSTDREIVTKVVLGDGKILVGRSIDTFEFDRTRLPLVFAKPASNICSVEDAKSCVGGCIDKNIIKGKILVCNRIADTLFVEGAAGVILQGVVDNSEVYSVPASVLNTNEFELLLAYMNSTKNPEGTILKSETIKDAKAPVVASFSSRGPNRIIGDILKPDITAPGVNILAAYSPVAPLRNDEDDKRRVKYHILSGTSMSCPHVTGVAAYVKTVHPNWSPAMIKSAIMTTAWAMNASSSKEFEFAYGSGHVNPLKASDPGLVYETTRDDYLKMLCALNYTAEKIRAIVGNDSTCRQRFDKKLSVRDVNYPTMAALVYPRSASTVKFSRILTNVGTPNSTYKANVNANPKLSIKVVPDNLSFKTLGEKKSFVVTVSINGPVHVGLIESASLVWSDGSHIVRSPIVVYCLLLM